MVPLTPRVHVHLHVSDLARSRDFYQRLLGVAPVKGKADYAKFLPDFVPLNLAISQPADRAAAPPAGQVSHLGIQVASPQEVRAHLDRVRAAGLDVRVEMDVDCCHANQDKFWARDPDGVEWELYYLRRDLGGIPLPTVPATAADLPTPACCAPDTQAAGG